MLVLNLEVGGSLLLGGMSQVEISPTVGNLQGLLVRVKVPPGTKNPM